MARRLCPAVQARVGAEFKVETVDCASEIGSGALPRETIPSAGLALRPTAKRGAGRALARLAGALRALPIPVIGRVADGAMILDLRCLEDEGGFSQNLAALAEPAGE